MQWIHRANVLESGSRILAALLLAGLLVPAPSAAQEETEEEMVAASPAGSGADEEPSDDESPFAREPWYSPVPAEQQAQVRTAAAALRQRLAGTSGDWVRRATCMLEKIEAPDADDRLIEWSRICPDYVQGESWEEREICSAGRDFTEEDLFEQLDAPAKVDQEGPRLRIFTHLGSEAYHLNRLFGGQQDQQVVVDELRRLDDDVQHAQSELSSRAARGDDGQRHYRAIHGWLTQRQQDPNSVYSCR